MFTAKSLTVPAGFFNLENHLQLWRPPIWVGKWGAVRLDSLL